MAYALAVTIVLAPLSASLLGFLFITRARYITLLTLVIMLIASVGILNYLSTTPQGYFILGGWSVPLGIRWSLDGLSGLLIFLTNIIALAIAAYSQDYFDKDKYLESYYWPIFLLLLTGLNALFLSNDLFNWYITLEIIGLSSVGLVALSNNKASDIAAFRYLLVSLAGSLCYLAGVAILYAEHAILDLTLLSDLIETNLTAAVSLSLMTVGLMLKGAIFPLHFWLAPAHSNAPAPVSALLSALVVKGAFFILLQIWINLYPIQYAQVVDVGLSILGIFAVIFGSYSALKASRLKLLIAYSTVAQLGYLMMYFPLSGYENYSKIALGGVVYFIFSHAFAKSALFLAAGNLQRLAGHDNIHRLGIYARHLPMTLFACAIAGASIIGLPPSGGFIAKWIFLNIALVHGDWYIVFVLSIGSLLSAAYIFRILNLSFYDDTNHHSEKIDNHKVSARMQWVPLLLSLAAVALGITALPVLNMLAPADFLQMNVIRDIPQ